MSWPQIWCIITVSNKINKDQDDEYCFGEADKLIGNIVLIRLLGRNLCKSFLFKKREDDKNVKVRKIKEKGEILRWV